MSRFNNLELIAGRCRECAKKIEDYEGGRGEGFQMNQSAEDEEMTKVLN